MNRLFICLLIATIGIASCKRTGSLFSGKKEKLVIVDPEFDYLKSKAKFRFNHNNKKVSATANFRIKKDSVIWISVSGFGLEAARVLMNKNKVHVIDKLKKQYYEYEFSELSKEYGFDFTFDMMQSVILGNLAEPYRDQKVVKSDKYFTYDIEKGQYQFSNFIGAESLKLEKVEVRDDSSKNTISVNYGDFVMVDKEVFPNSISAVIDYDSQGKPNTEIDISYSKLDIEQDPLSFPFNVPSRYGRK